jgi:hypothetical protein
MHNDPDKAKKKRSQGHYGYRSLPLELADPTRRFSIVLLDDGSTELAEVFLPANNRQENPAAALLLQLPTFYSDLHVDAVAGDAAFGYDLVLHSELHARLVIDLRLFLSNEKVPI